MLTIAIGSDHGGFEYKQKLIYHLASLGYLVNDLGTFTEESTHYPLFAAAVARSVASGASDFGIVICTSGEGVAIAANKIKGVRCGIGYNDEVSKYMRLHNDANVIAFGQKYMAYNDVERRVDIFLNTEFEGGRHQTRVDIINSLE